LLPLLAVFTQSDNESTPLVVSQVLPVQILFFLLSRRETTKKAILLLRVLYPDINQCFDSGNEAIRLP
jgi:hypothetical protein